MKRKSIRRQQRRTSASSRLGTFWTFEDVQDNAIEKLLDGVAAQQLCSYIEEYGLDPDDANDIGEIFDFAVEISHDYDFDDITTQDAWVDKLIDAAVILCGHKASRKSARKPYRKAMRKKANALEDSHFRDLNKSIWDVLTYASWLQGDNDDRKPDRDLRIYEVVTKIKNLCWDAQKELESIGRLDYNPW